jgi:hypothetical protein
MFMGTFLSYVSTSFYYLLIFFSRCVNVLAKSVLIFIELSVKASAPHHFSFEGDHSFVSGLGLLCVY